MRSRKLSKRRQRRLFMQRRLHGAQRRHVHGVRGRQIQGFHGARSMHSMSCQLRVACRFVLPLFVAPVCGIMPMPRIILGYICTRMCVRAHAWHVKRHRAQADSSCARIHADGDAERRRRERILQQQRVCCCCCRSLSSLFSSLCISI